MAKNIFKSTDVNLQSRRVLIDYPTTDNPVNTKDETSDDQVFEGPSVRELQLEAEKFRQSFEKEKEVLSKHEIMPLYNHRKLYTGEIAVEINN